VGEAKRRRERGDTAPIGDAWCRELVDTVLREGSDPGDTGAFRSEIYRPADWRRLLHQTALGDRSAVIRAGLVAQVLGNVIVRTVHFLFLAGAGLGAGSALPLPPMLGD
jgi:hypothetical protein